MFGRGFDSHRLHIFIHGRLLKRLKRPCWKRGRRVKACVGSNPMSSVVETSLCSSGVFLYKKDLQKELSKIDE